MDRKPIRWDLRLERAYPPDPSQVEEWALDPVQRIVASLRVGARLREERVKRRQGRPAARQRARSSSSSLLGSLP